MNRTPITDGWKVLTSLAVGFAGPPLLLVGLGVVLALAFTSCRSKPAPIPHYVRVTDSVEVIKRDTVIVHQRRVDTVKVKSDSLDSLVTIKDDSSVVVHDTLTMIPPLVVADLRALRVTVAAQDTLIHALYQHDTTQQWRIASRDKLIAELSKRHPFACGRRCGLVIGLTAGILIHRAAK